MNSTKEVRFDIYCEKCKHYEKRENEDPCFQCLDQGWNIDSHKPIMYDEAPKKSTKTSKTVKKGKEDNSRLKQAIK